VTIPTICFHFLSVPNEYLRPAQCAGIYSLGETTMPKNIVIFSDGTGQRGGIKFDERRSNIYKLYRAARCGPDSCVDPTLQIAYYDPGIGTTPNDLGTASAIYRWLHNLVSQATGLGITANIQDCYCEILKVFEPGDRIYLFGFSRGAYTVRCLASVLSHCGIPTQMPDGSPLKRDQNSLSTITKEAVTKIYQHVGGEKDGQYAEERKEMAKNFRKKYGSGNDETSNANPYFVGVFDTVASIASFSSLVVAMGVLGIIISFFSFLLSYWQFNFWTWFVLIAGVLSVGSFIEYLETHLKFPTGVAEKKWWKDSHTNPLRMRFLDNILGPSIQYARHAISIDEHRASFDRVSWGNKKDEWPARPKGAIWFKQFWFAGNHSDIGGSYAENESRLSDVALGWMIEELGELPEKLILDRSVLRVFPDHKGMQHEEGKSITFKYASKLDRTLKDNATLHPSVFLRFAEKEVLHFDEMKPYRPSNLSKHEELVAFYEVKPTSSA
jgi:uncharacterized protein (DUF2235 family)